MHVAIAIAAGPVCEFKRSVVTNVEPDKIRGTELDDTQLWNVCVASTTIRIYALLLHIHSPHRGGGGSQHHQGKLPRCFGWNLSHAVDFRNVEKWCVFLMDLFLVINVCPAHRCRSLHICSIALVSGLWIIWMGKYITPTLDISFYCQCKATKEFYPKYQIWYICSTGFTS